MWDVLMKNYTQSRCTSIGGNPTEETLRTQARRYRENEGNRNGLRPSTKQLPTIDRDPKKTFNVDSQERARGQGISLSFLFRTGSSVKSRTLLPLVDGATGSFCFTFCVVLVFISFLFLPAKRKRQKNHDVTAEGLLSSHSSGWLAGLWRWQVAQEQECQLSTREEAFNKFKSYRQSSRRGSMYCKTFPRASILPKECVWNSMMARLRA